MSYGLDTSVVLRLLVGVPERQATKAQALLDQLSDNGQQASVCDLVIAEVYFALQFHYQVPKREAVDVLREFMNSPEIHSDGKARQVLANAGLESANPGFVDRMIHAHYLSSGASMATFEKSARKLDQVEVM